MRAFTAAIILLTLLLLVPADVAEAATIHVVRPGENLFRISQRYRVSIEAIAAENGLADPDRIYVGQTLRIPTTGTGEQGSEPKVKMGTRASQNARREVHRAPVIHVVSRGDTLYGIASRHGTSVRALMEANRLRSETIYPGQRLAIPSSPRTRTLPRPAPDPVPFLPQAAPPPAPAQTPRTVLPPLVVGTEVAAPAPMRVRSEPKSYYPTQALVAAGTPLVLLSEEDGWFEVQLPNGDVGWVSEDDFRVPEGPAPVPEPQPETARGLELVREAMTYLGTRYRWGGESPRGVDCSGFVYIVFTNRVPGLVRLRSYDYFRMGVRVDRANLQPGDLVFFTTYARGPSHVGIYTGDGKFIHASSSAGMVTITSMDDPYYTARYIGARRLLRPQPP